jgi:hypothetical protein
MAEKEALHLADDQMVENRIGDDLVWGFKTFREEPGGVMQYVWEVRFRAPGEERVAYFREKRVGDPLGLVHPTNLSVVPETVSRMVRLLTYEEYRIRMYYGYFRVYGDDGSFNAEEAEAVAREEAARG